MAVPEHILQSSVQLIVTNDPKPLTIRCRKGKTLEIATTLVDSSGDAWDLDGWTVHLTVKEKLHYSATVFTADDSGVYITKSDELGLVTLEVPPSVTAAFSWDIGEYELEVRQASPEATYVLLRGRWVNIPEVSS